MWCEYDVIGLLKAVGFAFLLNIAANKMFEYHITWITNSSDSLCSSDYHVTPIVSNKEISLMVAERSHHAAKYKHSLMSLIHIYLYIYKCNNSIREATASFRHKKVTNILTLSY